MRDLDEVGTLPQGDVELVPLHGAEFRNAMHRMRAELGTKVSVQGSEDKGKLIIHYYSREDLDRIYRVIVGNE